MRNHCAVFFFCPQETGFPIQEGDGRVYGLALSRTLGDRYLKTESEKAIIAEPHVSAPCRASPGQLLVVGSDGLWDVTTPQRAVEIAGAVREEGGVRKECAEALLRYARAHRSRDDCSVVVVDMDAHALGLLAPSEVPTRVAGGVGSPGLAGRTTAAAGAAWSNHQGLEETIAAGSGRVGEAGGGGAGDGRI